MSIHYWYHVHNHEDRRGQVMICQCWVTQCHSPFKANVPETEVFFNQLHVLQPLSQWGVNNFFKLKMDFQNPECIGHKKDKRWEFIMILQLMNKPTTYFRPLLIMTKLNTGKETWDVNWCEASNRKKNILWGKEHFRLSRSIGRKHTHTFLNQTLDGVISLEVTESRAPGNCLESLLSKTNTGQRDFHTPSKSLKGHAKQNHIWLKSWEALHFFLIESNIWSQAEKPFYGWT